VCAALTFYMIDGKVCAACGWNSWSSVIGWREACDETM